MLENLCNSDSVYKLKVIDNHSSEILYRLNITHYDYNYNIDTTYLLGKDGGLIISDRLHIWLFIMMSWNHSLHYD